MKVRERGTARSEELRRLLKQKREQAGLSLRDLGARLQRDHKVIDRLKSGEKRPTVLALIDIGAALGFDPATVVRRLMKIDQA
jgi:ribosome-binding protein aMBF1 (putative translation factor)